MCILEIHVNKEFRLSKPGFIQYLGIRPKVAKIDFRSAKIVEGCLNFNKIILSHEFMLHESKNK